MGIVHRTWGLSLEYCPSIKLRTHGVKKKGNQQKCAFDENTAPVVTNELNHSLLFLVFPLGLITKHLIGHKLLDTSPRTLGSHTAVKSDPLPQITRKTTRGTKVLGATKHKSGKQMLFYLQSCSQAACAA